MLIIQLSGCFRPIAADHCVDGRRHDENWMWQDRNRDLRWMHSPIQGERLQVDQWDRVFSSRMTQNV